MQLRTFVFQSRRFSRNQRRQEGLGQIGFGVKFPDDLRQLAGFRAHQSTYQRLGPDLASQLVMEADRCHDVNLRVRTEQTGGFRQEPATFVEQQAGGKEQAVVSSLLFPALLTLLDTGTEP